MMRYRLAVASRALAAILGGYGLASAAAAWLPMQRADAVVTAQMSAFVVYTCGVIWVFATRNAWRAWAGILLPAALFGGLFLIGRMVGGA